MEDSHCRVKKLKLSDCGVTGEGYAALASALKSNPSHLDELDLRGNDPGDSGVELLTSVLNNQKCKLRLLKSDAAEKACAYLTSVLGRNPLLLTELDLSEKKPGDSGVKQFCALLEDSHCRLKKLKLSDCGVTGEGYAALALALKSNPSHLKELDLRGNDPGDSGVKLLTSVINQKCKLRLLKSDAAEKACKYLTSVLGRNPLLLTELDLSEKKPGDSGVKQFCALLKDSHCRFKKLKLSNSEEGYAALASALKSNPSHLEELDLRGNDPGDSGVKLLTSVLNNQKCKLRLLKSDAAEKACLYLTSVLGRDPLLLTELDLSKKKPGDSGVKQFCALLKDSHCRFKKLKLSDCGVTGEGYAALASALKSNPSHLEELDLRGNDPGDSGVELLTSVLNNQKCKLRLLKSDAAEKACAYLTSVLGRNPLLLTELDLSEKKPGDSGVKQFCALLGDSHCRLKKLRLSDCGVTGKGYAALASTLKSNPSHLEELDLRGNDPGDSGVKLLTSVLKHQKCKLRLLKTDAAEKACEYLTSVLGRNPLLLTELDLSEKKPGDSGVKQFCALLEDSHCRLKKLKLSDCSVTGEGYAALASALKSNPSHLEELDLRGNDPGDSGVKLLTSVLNNQKCKLRLLKSDAAEKACAYLTSVLGRNPLLLTELDLSEKKPGDSGVRQFCALLGDSHCRLKKLRLSDCGVTGEGYAALASALKSNPSHLKELDLRGNDPGDSGVELLTSVLNQKCKLRLLKSYAAEKACEYLTSVLGRNPLLLTELDLSEKIPGDSGVKQFCALLEDSHCRLKKLKLSNSGITEEGCAALTSALTLNPSHLIQLNMSGNKLGDLGVEQISALLRNPDCKLQSLQLPDCGVTGEGYAALASAFKSNPSHLEELDLRGNDPGDSGVKLLTSVLNNQKCTLRLLKWDAAQKACAYLTSVLGRNPLLLTELDLSEKKPGDSGVKQFCALLEDSHCKFKKLKLNNSKITKKGCAALISALTSNPSHLRELDLSGNELRDSAVKQISALLENEECKLQRLLLHKNDIKRDGCESLVRALTSNPSHLTELDLSGNELGDSAVKQISALLGNKECKLQRLLLHKNDIKKDGCESLVWALTSNPSHLRELDLSGNELGDLAVKQISTLLGNKECKLQRLLLHKNDIKKDGCESLVWALTSNPSHLTELDLSGNKLGDSGATFISALLENKECKLQRLLLNKCSITEEGCAALTTALTLNLSHLMHLDLRGNTLGDSGVKQISALMEDPNNKLKIELDYPKGWLDTASNVLNPLNWFKGGRKYEPSAQQSEAGASSESDQGRTESETEPGDGSEGNQEQAKSETERGDGTGSDQGEAKAEIESGDASEGPVNLQEEKITPFNTVTFDHLNPGTKYCFNVVAVLNSGAQSSTASTSAETSSPLTGRLQDLGLKRCYPEQLSLSSVLEIGMESVTDEPAQSHSSLPWIFLKRLMMANVTARSVRLNMSDDSKAKKSDTEWYSDEENLSDKLLLEGFPIELVDGDAANIPMRWIKDVLTQLNDLVKSNKMLVVAVLGIQSTGKSALLNTMFGVQFAVSSGRCTRGAFMMLIRLKDDMKRELNSDFLLIIDTEGLKSIQLAQLDYSYEHDNELATLVVGLSDVTIINIAMENSTEMKDVLQIVVHAFLRMKEIGKRPRCLFVHQNVADVSAHDMNMKDRKMLLEQLNEMTQAASRMENKEEDQMFTDVMRYDPETDNSYVPGLWHGTPPMSPVSSGYSEAVTEFKKRMISVLKESKTPRNTVMDFHEWTDSLWRAVKFENFIFSFRNSLVADAYRKVCTEFNKWE
ncbi:hypothetical protein ACEWY4_026577 [Coilia grayii]|uniref:VLIG-type G domain-containing protein n=1 Tax=Coilia grayii TaxID=363190 RepID=A0ABD1IU40_9TELE